MAITGTREELLEVLLAQAASKIEFLHGCLTDPHREGVPGGFSYAYPEQTLQFLGELRQVLPEREFCFHSMTVEGCASCEAGAHARVVMARFRSEQTPTPEAS